PRRPRANSRPGMRSRMIDIDAATVGAKACFRRSASGPSSMPRKTRQARSRVRFLKATNARAASPPPHHASRMPPMWGFMGSTYARSAGGCEVRVFDADDGARRLPAAAPRVEDAADVGIHVLDVRAQRRRAEGSL